METIKCVKCGKEISGGYYNAPSGPHCPDCWEQRKKEERPAAYLQFKGTPGPWCYKVIKGGIFGSQLDTLNIYKGVNPLENYQERAVSSVLGDIGEEQINNARLISAAPDLLEAAKLAYVEWGTLSQRPETFRALDAAIRKALGNV